jgi:hypothetical protein
MRYECKVIYIINYIAYHLHERYLKNSNLFCNNKNHNIDVIMLSDGYSILVKYAKQDVVLKPLRTYQINIKNYFKERLN